MRRTERARSMRAMPNIAVSGRTRLFPIIGYPVSHVHAPSVFNTLFSEARVDALCIPLGLPPEAVAATCRGLLASDTVGGLLVTVPYKRQLAHLADELSDQARRAGAVNALRRDADGRIFGELFDGLGFVQGLRAAGHELRGKRILLLGAGGAGSAIASSLGDVGAAQVTMFDVSHGLAIQLATHLGAHFRETRFATSNSPQDAEAQFVINATPLGLKHSDPLPFEVQSARPGTVICDIIMEPSITPMMAAAAARGLQVHGGRMMLDHQASPYLEFFGFKDIGERVVVGPAGPMLRPCVAGADGV